MNLPDLEAGEFQVNQAILEWATAECVRQETDAAGPLRMVRAWNMASLHWMHGEPLTTRFVSRLGEIIDPYKNPTWNYEGTEHAWRRTPVTFASGATAIDWREVPRAMSCWCESISHADERDDCDGQVIHEAVRAFLTIHPLADGNGRVAAILYNWLNGSLIRPEPLPRYNFG